MSSGPRLHVADLCRTFGHGSEAVAALKDVSISVSSGQTVALLGNNGAGKSTLMSIAAGLIRADSGSVEVCGNLVERGRSSSDLGLAPQEEALYPTLTVRRNLALFGELHGLRGSDLDRRVDAVASNLTINDLLDRTAATLSGGQRRRLHTGLALMHDPSVLLLDEPTVGVDIDARVELLDFVRHTAAEGAAILYSTHQLSEVEELGAFVVLIDRGVVLARGSVDEIVAEHSQPVAELHFRRSDVDMPLDLAPLLEESRVNADGEMRIVLELENATTPIAQVIDRLDDRTRQELIGATVVAPSLERAYLRLTRGVDTAATDPVMPLGRPAAESSS